MLNHEKIVDIVKRFPTDTYIYGSILHEKRGVEGALYVEGGHIFFLHNNALEANIIGARPCNDSKIYKYGYFLGGTNYDHLNIPMNSFFLAPGTTSPPVKASTFTRYITDYISELHKGGYKYGEITLSSKDKKEIRRVKGYLYLSRMGDVYFIHNDPLKQGGRPDEGINHLGEYSWRLDIQNNTFSYCDPYSFIPMEEPGKYDPRNLGRKLPEVDVSYAQPIGVVDYIVHPTPLPVSNKPDPIIIKSDRLEIVLFSKKKSKPKICDVLPMQSAVIIKQNKTNK